MQLPQGLPIQLGTFGHGPVQARALGALLLPVEVELSPWAPCPAPAAPIPCTIVDRRRRRWRWQTIPGCGAPLGVKVPVLRLRHLAQDLPGVSIPQQSPVVLASAQKQARSRSDQARLRTPFVAPELPARRDGVPDIPNLQDGEPVVVRATITCVAISGATGEPEHLFPYCRHRSAKGDDLPLPLQVPHDGASARGGARQDVLNLVFSSAR